MLAIFSFVSLPWPSWFLAQVWWISLYVFNFYFFCSFTKPLHKMLFPYLGLFLWSKCMTILQSLWMQFVWLLSKGIVKIHHVTNNIYQSNNWNFIILFKFPLAWVDNFYIKCHGLIISPQECYLEVLISRTSEWDIIWK